MGRLAYSVVEKDRYNFEIVEKATGQVIVKADDALDAREIMRNLNKGRAFDGWTPSFFLKRFEITE